MIDLKKRIKIREFVSRWLWGSERRNKNLSWTDEHVTDVVNMIQDWDESNENP